MIRSWIIIILYLVLIILFAYMNHSWYKHCNKINEDWLAICKKLIYMGEKSDSS